MPKKWENHWNNISSVEERDHRNNKLFTLGNLAIITQKLNTSIRDSSWKIKKVGKGDKGGLERYSTGIETLEPYLKYDNWDESKIEERANYLFSKAIEIWDIDN